MTEIGFVIEVEAPEETVNISDLMDAKKESSDLELRIELPDGKSESKFISRNSLHYIQNIVIRMKEY